MNNLTLRLLTGSVYIVVTIVCILLNQISAFLFGMTLVFMCSRELLFLLRGKSDLWSVFDSLSIVAVFSVCFLNQNDVVNPGVFNGWFIAFFLLWGIVFLYRSRASLLNDLSSLTLAAVYIALPLALFFRTGSIEFVESASLLHYEGKQILLIFILIWISDSFAYVTGRLIGSTLLMKSVSPGKTLEGLLGGMVVTVGASFFFLSYFIPLTPVQGMVLALIVVFTGVAGDLFESLIKRTLGVKDSGRSLPGHGGFLDRFDSVLFAGPAAYAYLRYFLM